MDTNIVVHDDGKSALVDIVKPDDFVIRDLMAANMRFEDAVATPERALKLLADLADRDSKLIELGTDPDEGSVTFKSCACLDDDNRLQDNSLKDLRDFLNPSGEVSFRRSNTPRVLRGLGGLLARSALRTIISRFGDEQGQFAFRTDDKGNFIKAAGTSPEFRVKTSGKITDWLFVADKPGSVPLDPTKYEVGSGHGHVSINILNQEFDSDKALIDCKPSRTEFLHWDIEILSCKVYRRKDDVINDDPYPAIGKEFPALKFPVHATDPDDGRSIWCRCLDHKLFAHGPKQIKIDNVYRRIDGGPLERLPDDPGNEDSYYLVTLDDCFDIMFKGFPPATHLPRQREYCLGRCEEPPVVNTGG